jgi:hypothetical protein
MEQHFARAGTTAGTGTDQNCVGSEKCGVDTDPEPMEQHFARAGTTAGAGIFVQAAGRSIKKIFI